MEIGKAYKRHQKRVLEIHDGYLQRRDEYSQVTDIGDGISLDFFQRRVQGILNERFTVAVAGEVKAGKSTFINALLGADLLPSDVLQATSAIVEIAKNDYPTLTIKYASGKIHEESFSNDFSSIYDIKNKLSAVCQVPDEYREIPTTLLDDAISGSARAPKVTDAFLKNLQEKSQIYDLEAYRTNIQDYCNTRSKDEIPIKIEVGFPLQWDFDEMRIVDTPEVNAVGGIQERSHSYLDTADALLFVHTIKPVESSSFREFVQKLILENKRKEALFLILTHAGQYENEEVKRLREDAIRLYSHYISEERILAVDSILQLIALDLKNGRSYKEIRADGGQKRVLLPGCRDAAEDKDITIEEIVTEMARYQDMFDAINKFWFFVIFREKRV